MSEGNGDHPEIIIRLTGPTAGSVLDKAINLIALMSAGTKQVGSVEDMHAATGLVIEVKQQLDPQIKAVQNGAIQSLQKGVEAKDIETVTDRILERGKGKARK
jgi:hypothetical protein